jgi:hypothetical protein
VGEALVSLLDEHGSPTITERAWILPPASRIGPITDAERQATHEINKPFYGEYEQTVDRESAYEKLTGRTARRTEGAPVGQDRQAGQGSSAPSGSAGDQPAAGSVKPQGTAQAAPPAEPPARPRRQKTEPWVEAAPEPPSSSRRSEPWAQPPPSGRDGAETGIAGALSDFIFGRTGPRGGHYDGALEAAGKSAARSVGSGIGRAILRGALGSIIGSGRRR